MYARTRCANTGAKTKKRNVTIHVGKFEIYCLLNLLPLIMIWSKSTTVPYVLI